VESTFALLAVEKMARYKAVALIATVSLTTVMVVLLRNVNVAVDSLREAVVPGGSIQNAINKTQAGTEILIQNGSYCEKSYPIVVNKTVALVGENADVSGLLMVIALCKAFFWLDVAASKSRVWLYATLKSSFDVAAVHLANANDVEVTDCILSECAVGIMLRNISTASSLETCL